MSQQIILACDIDDVLADNAHSNITRCKNWQEVAEYFNVTG